jgi:hypothetical protein
MKGLGEVQVAVTGGLALPQQLADSSPVVPLVFCAYLFWKAWLDYRVQIMSLPTEPDQPVRRAPPDEDAAWPPLPARTRKL